MNTQKTQNKSLKIKRCIQIFLIFFTWIILSSLVQGNQIQNLHPPSTLSNAIFNTQLAEKQSNQPKQPNAPILGENNALLEKKRYTGKLISLNFQTISLKAVLQLFAEFTGLNVIVSDQVKGDITLRLNNIPWDEALDIILQTHSLGKQQTNNVLLIAPLNEFLKREQENFKTNNTSTSEPLYTELLQLNFAKAQDIVTALKDKSTSLLSSRGFISSDARTNTVWLQDTRSKIAQVKKLVQKLDQPVRQVLIESRIVNITREAIQDLGLRFGVAPPQHLENDNQPNSPSTSNAITEHLNIDLGALAGSNPATVGIALAKLGNNILLDLELSALESVDKAEIIANPRLMTTNQQAAMIESGEEIPYQESTTSGATSVSFKKAVVSLKVTPQITSGNKILMDLEIHQDTPSGRMINNVPAIITKQIETNVLVNNGQTAVLGGIFQQGKNNTIHRVPFFGELPGIGVLFRNKQTRVKNEELLIFITPQIINSPIKPERKE